MVQKKGPDIFVSSTSPQKKSCAKTERTAISPSNLNQDNENKGEAGLKKKMKKARSIKRISELENLDAQVGQRYVYCNKTAVWKKTSLVTAATDGLSPNYMKPTTSSDARKGKSGVSFPTSTTDHKVKKKPRNSKKLSSFKVSSPSSSTNIPAKVLTKKRSMRLVRSSSVKKCLEIPLFSKINASKATCSSTLKDSKFPKELKLSPGAAESECTSAMKVCPYTYCSLNGHRHESLPPLKSFISAKRRMLKTQKIMKIKRIPSQKRNSNKSEKHDDVEHEEDHPYSLEIPPLSQKMGDDFFIEIYKKSCEEFERMLFAENKTYAADNDIDDCRSDISSEISSTKASEKESGFEIAECLVESHLDQAGEVSDSYMEESTIYPEYVACDSQVQEYQRSELLQNFDGIKIQESIVNDSGQDNSNSIAENKEKEFFPEAKNMDSNKSMTVYQNNILNDEGNRKILVYRQLNEAYEEDSRAHHPFSSSVSVNKEFQLDEKDYRDQVQEYQMPALLQDFDRIKSERSMVNASSQSTNDVDDEERGCFPEARNMDSDESVTEYPNNNLNDDGNKEILVFKQPNEAYEEDSHEHDPFSSSSSVNEEAQQDEKDYSDQTFGEIVPQEQIQKIFKAHADEDQHFRGDDVSTDGGKTHVDLGGNHMADDTANAAPSEPCEDIPDTAAQKFELTQPELKELHKQRKGTCKNTEFGASQDIETREVNIECRIPFEDTEGNGEYSGNRDTSNMPEISVPNHSLVETYQGKVKDEDARAEKVSNVETDVCISENTPTDSCPVETYQDDPTDRDTTEVESDPFSWPESYICQIYETAQDSSDENDSSYDPPGIGSCIDNADNSKEAHQMSQAENMTRNSIERYDDVNPELQLGDHVKPHHEKEAFPSDNKLAEDKSESELQARFHIARKRIDEDEEAMRAFNPREPNFLPLEPDPEVETVDLRHQLIEERKNSEEWMIDHALQRVVRKLGPARKKKVELLVEAFESVSPTASKVCIAY